MRTKAFYGRKGKGKECARRFHLRGRKPKRSMIQRRLKKLMRIIPGCQGMNMDMLFSITADYILHLQLQVTVLKGISSLYGV
ncbi:hypothetical protein AAC387_Pa04g0797 [Persea americana]